MPGTPIHTSRTRRIWLLGGLLVISSVGAAATAWMQTSIDAEAALFLRKQEKIIWQTITEEEVASGTTIRADRNVLIHFPAEMADIHREVLFGWKGKEVRYWGYCFPDGYDFLNPPKKKFGFPGRMFLSEAERAFRADQKNSTMPKYSVLNPPTQAEIAQKGSTSIRHEFEIFHGGDICYIMTSQILSLGLDDDADDLNDSLEKQFKTDPLIDDTDGDGVSDGKETQRLRTDPLSTDTDTDGLSDGVEDKNQNGRTESGETSPMLWDSDRDGLCDGFCQSRSRGQTCTAESLPTCVDLNNRYTGEDKNLDGVLDDDETDPLKIDTDGDGISDEQEYFKCLLEEVDQDC